MTPTVRVDCAFFLPSDSLGKNAVSEKSRRYSNRVIRAFAILNSLVRVNSCSFWAVPVMNAPLVSSSHQVGPEADPARGRGLLLQRDLDQVDAEGVVIDVEVAQQGGRLVEVPPVVG